MRCSFVCLLALLVSPTAPVFAQDEPISPAAGLIVPVSTLNDAGFVQRVHVPVVDEPQPRPAALVPLYASLATLNALDVHSTMKGISSGTTREANPMLKPFVSNQAAFIALKAATTVTTILLTESTRKKHPKRAVVLMIVSNAVMAAIVASNYRAHRTR